MASTQKERDAWREMPYNTPQEICDMIDVFVGAWDRTAVEQYSAGCGFGHIVLGDMNLENGSIEYCLGLKDNWFDCKIKENTTDDRADFGFDASSKNSWERWGYDELCAVTAAVDEFLHFLLSIPEKKRIAAMNFYFGD